MEPKITLASCALLISIVLIVGCTGQSFDAAGIARSNQAVNAFLSDYPDARIVASYVTNASVSQDCDNAQLDGRDYWKVVISDEATNLAVNAWIDASTQNIVCLVKAGGGKETLQPDLESLTGINAGPQPQNLQCYTQYDCSYDEHCSGGICKKLNCQVGYHAENHECVKDSPTPQQAANTGTATPSPAPYPETNVQVTASDHTLGNKDAAVVIVEFADFQCPFCKRFYEETFPEIKREYIETGKAKFVFRNFPLDAIHPQARDAGLAAECAGEQGKYWEMHSLLFATQSTWSVSNPRAAFTAYAGEMELEKASFETCYDSGKYKDRISKDSSFGTEIGVTGTPTFFINGKQLVGAQPYSVFKEAIEAAYQQAVIDAESTKPANQLAAEDDLFIGDRNAKLTIVEFSDFECQFCGRFFRDTLPLIEDNYISTGKVRLVYRNFPLAIHPNAGKAAAAANCANEQGKWKEMHDWLYSNQVSWAGFDAASATVQFKAAGATVGLNTAQFNSCLDTDKYADELARDIQDGNNAGVSGTPTFFIKGQRIVGAQPYSVFREMIDSSLGE